MVECSLSLEKIDNTRILPLTSGEVYKLIAERYGMMTFDTYWFILN